MFIFQQSYLWSTHFFHWFCSIWFSLVKKSSTVDMISSYKLFSPPFYTNFLFCHKALFKNATQKDILVIENLEEDSTTYKFLLQLFPSLHFEQKFIGLVGTVLANGPGDLGSILGRIIPKTLKMVLDTSLLNTSNIRYVSRVKWSNPGKGVAPSPTPQCSSNWKGSLLVTLDYGCQLYFTFTTNLY